MSYFNLFAVKSRFEDISGLPPELVNPFLWIFCWLFIFACMLFILYWALAWGVLNTGESFSVWVTDYGVSLVTDIFLIEITKILLLYVFSLESSRPQLKSINNMIKEATFSLIQENNNNSNDDGDRSNNSYNKLLYNTNHVRILQHLFPSCRIARMSGTRDIAASAILRHLNNIDLYKCQIHKNFKLGTFSFITVFIITVFGTLNWTLVENSLDIILSAVWSGFIVANKRLMNFSIGIIIAMYAAVFIVIVYHLTMFRASIKIWHQCK